MIQTALFNRYFGIARNHPSNISGIIQNNYIDTGIFVLGRISNPSIRERNLFQSREMNLTSIIYCEPYDYDQKNDVFVNDDVVYLIKEIVPTRDFDGNVAFLKVYADETNVEINIAES